MGKKILDKHSIRHFIFGSLSFVLVKSINIPIYLNFILTNGVHLLIELIENNISPTGKILETNINHISDIVLFLLGWSLAYYYNLYKFYKKFPSIIKIILWLILSFEIIHEIYREINPYFDIGLFKGAYIDNLEV